MIDVYAGATKENGLHAENERNIIILGRRIGAQLNPRETRMVFVGGIYSVSVYSSMML